MIIIQNERSTSLGMRFIFPSPYIFLASEAKKEWYAMFGLSKCAKLKKWLYPRKNCLFFTVARSDFCMLKGMCPT